MISIKMTNEQIIFNHFFNSHHLPISRILKFREPEARERLCGDFYAVFNSLWSREKLLHQTHLVGPQRLHPPPLRRYQGVRRTQAVGDLLLLGGGRGCDLDPKESVFADVQQAITSRAARDVLLELFAVLVLLKAVLKESVRIGILETKCDEHVRCGDLTPALQEIDAALGKLQRIALVEDKIAIPDQRVIPSPVTGDSRRGFPDAGAM